METTEENGATHKPHVGPWLLGQYALSAFIFLATPRYPLYLFLFVAFWVPIVSWCFARTVAPVAVAHTVSPCSIFAPSCHDQAVAWKIS